MTIAHPGGVAVQRHSYGDDPEQFGELRLPAGPGPHAVIIYFHGGGWRAGVTLAGAEGICTELTTRGFATWSVEYRRVGNGGGWPMTFDDVVAASEYVKQLAEDADIDLGRVFLGGQSAGGQLALWLASRIAKSTGPLAAVGAVFALAPPTDLRATAEREPGGALPKLLGGMPTAVGDRYAAVSPLDLAPIGVPHLLVHGTGDTLVPYAMSQQYVAAATRSGDRVEFVTLEGVAEHRDLWNPTSTAFAQTMDAVTRFLRAYDRANGD